MSVRNEIGTLRALTSSHTLTNLGLVALASRLGYYHYLVVKSLIGEGVTVLVRRNNGKRKETDHVR
jgi:hypothetical protein